MNEMKLLNVPKKVSEHLILHSWLKWFKISMFWSCQKTKLALSKYNTSSISVNKEQNSKGHTKNTNNSSNTKRIETKFISKNIQYPY